MYTRTGRAMCSHTPTCIATSSQWRTLQRAAVGFSRQFRNAATPSCIAAGTTPPAVVDYHPSAEAQQRVAELIAQEKEGGLSPEEKAELDRFMDLEHNCEWPKRAPGRS
jgi:hypothetical protein